MSILNPKGDTQLLFNRYGIYMIPEAENFAELGAAWLGWDVQKGCTVPYPQEADAALREATKVPRKYGFHGTIKPPFHLVEGATYDSLLSQAQTLCASLAPVDIEALSVRKSEFVLVLAPEGDLDQLANLAATVLQKLDHFRASTRASELVQHRKFTLTPLQETNLKNWGHPYVLDDFKFHITLSGHMPPKDLDQLEALANAHFAQHLERPLPVTSLTLVGEAGDGRFHALHRLPLSGRK